MPAPYCYEHPRPSVTVDVAVFALLERRLNVLLIRRRHDPFAGRWALPGGFLEMEEPVEQAARRELLEETGLTIEGPIEPIGFFGEPGRDPRGRTITLAFAAVIRPDDHAVRGGDDAAEARWLHANGPLDLAFDHHLILARAMSWLHAANARGELGPTLLPRPFLLADAQAMFQETGHRARHAPAWIARMLKVGRIEPCGPGQCYRMAIDT